MERVLTGVQSPEKHRPTTNTGLRETAVSADPFRMEFRAQGARMRVRLTTILPRQNS